MAGGITHGPASVAKHTYYKTEMTNVRLREWWRVAGGIIPGTLGYLLVRFGRWPEANVGVAHKELLVIPGSDLPAEAVTALDADLTVLMEAGFRRELTLYSPTLGATVGRVVVFSAEDAACWASWVFARSGAGESQVTTTGLALTTLTADGGVSITSNLRPGFFPPRHIRSNYLAGADVRVVIGAHVERMQKLDIVKVPADELLKAVRRVSDQIAEFQIQRGVWVPMADEEVERVGRLAAARTS